MMNRTPCMDSIVYFTLLVNIAQIYAQLEESRIPVVRIQTSSLWQPRVDICQDPVHGGLHHGHEVDLDLAVSNRMELSIKLRTFHHHLLHKKRLFEASLCPGMFELAKDYTLDDVISINHTSTGNNQLHNQATQLYKDISRLVYVFSVLDSDVARQCCTGNPSIYLKLKNRILPEVYNMVSGAILNWPVRSCTMSITTSLGNQLTCEETRTLVLLVYRHAKEETERILQLV